jgi:hypothetical protein
MNVINALKKARLLLSGVKLSKLQLSNTSIIQFDGDTLEKGTAVYMEDASGEALLAADGSYPLYNGGSFVIKGGVVESVTGLVAPLVPAGPVPQAQAAASGSAVSGSVATTTLDDGTGATQGTDIASLLSALATALQPIQDSLNQVLQVLPSLQSWSTQIQSTEKLAKETQLSLAQTIKVVEKIAEEPAVPVKMSIEKPATKKEVSTDIKQSRAYQILNSK